jgi:hypothetical protein
MIYSRCSIFSEPPEILQRGKMKSNRLFLKYKSPHLSRELST